MNEPAKHQPLLRGDEILLRPLVKADAQAMFRSLADQEVARLTGTHQTFDFADVERFCERSRHQLDRYDYVICDRNDPTAALGEVVLNDIDDENRCANFRGSLYAQAFFNRGMGSEAIVLLMDFAFNELALNRVELEVFEFNSRAIRVYEKIGFKHEGRKRQVLRWDGEYFDALVMGLVATDRSTA